MEPVYLFLSDVLTDLAGASALLQFTALRGWIADIDGRKGEANRLLAEVEVHLAHLDPAHYLRVRLHRYSALDPDSVDVGAAVDRSCAIQRIDFS